MGTDVGKSAKRMGKTHPRDAKKFERPVAKPPAGVSPHKVRRLYVMTVTETRRTVHISTHRYETKQARDQAKALMQKEAARSNPWNNWTRGNESHKTEETCEYAYADEIAVPQPSGEQP